MKKARAVLVGRGQEIGELVAGLEEASAGHGKLFLIDGEPGIGKTRLTEEIASRARELGAMVLWSRCWEASGAPAYWPWIQLVRACLRAVVGNEFFTLAEAAIVDIQHILPEACEVKIDRRPTPLPSDPEEARFRLFDAIRTLLKTAAGMRPLVLVLDDLGAADRPSLLMLRFLARELYDSRIMVVANYRDSELKKSPALAEALGDLAREAVAIRLRGFSREKVAQLIESHACAQPSEEAVGAVLRATGGNPFFIQSILKLVPMDLLSQVEQGALGGRLKLSNGLGATIEGYMAPLSAEARRLLIIAAVFGREVDAGVLAHIAGIKPQEALDNLTGLVAAGLLSEADSQIGEHYRFVHSIVRDTLYEAIPAAERARLHNQIGETLEQTYGDSESHLSALAYHFFEGAREGSPDRALNYAVRAAERATELAAFEEAARSYQIALSAMKLSGRYDVKRRCEILLALGEAQARGADYPGARDAFCQAAELAQRLGEREMLAHAALGYPGLQCGAPSDSNDESVRLLERALEAFPKQDDAWRAMLMARLASELYYRPSAQERRIRLADEAVQIARRSDDKRALLAILGHRDLTLSGPDSLAARFKNAEEMTRVAEELGSHLGLYMGFLSRTIYFRHIGQLAEAEAEAEAMALIARMTRLPVCSWGAQCFAASRALGEGRFAEGERIARECVNFAERMRGGDASDLYWPVMIAPMWELGRLSEIEPMALKTVEQRRTFPAYRALLALIYLGLGETRKARADFEVLAMRGFEDLNHDNTFLACATALAELCFAFGETGRASQLLKALAPYENLNAVFGPLGGYGAMARYLGLLAATASRYTEAEEYFQKALTINYQNNALAYVAYTHADYAAMLFKRGSQRDAARAEDLLSKADKTAEAIGMKALRMRIESLKLHAQTRHVRDIEANYLAAHSPNGARPLPNFDFVPAAVEQSNPLAELPMLAKRPEHAPILVQSFALARGSELDEVNPHMVGDAVFRRDGDYWTISYGGQLVRLKHVKGLACLSYLLGHPATDVHAANLASVMDRLAEESSAESFGTIGETRADLMTDAGPVLDSQAKSEYRRRLNDLREELADAHAMNDLGRSARAEEEIDFIMAELSRALGLRGRDRRACSPAERARLNVTKAIKAVLTKIAQHHRLLASHLEATVRTGTFCSYKPDPSSPICWKFS